MWKARKSLPIVSGAGGQTNRLLRKRNTSQPLYLFISHSSLDYENDNDKLLRSGIPRFN